MNDTTRTTSAGTTKYSVMSNAPNRKTWKILTELSAAHRLHRISAWHNNHELTAHSTKILMGPPRHEGSTREAASSRVRRAEQGEALPGSSAPRGGPQLELSRRKLKTWSKSETSAAVVQPLEFFCPCIYYTYVIAFREYSRDKCRSDINRIFFHKPVVSLLRPLPTISPFLFPPSFHLVTTDSLS